jgi:hypothetical protein
LLGSIFINLRTGTTLANKLLGTVRFLDFVHRQYSKLKRFLMEPTEWVSPSHHLKTLTDAVSEKVQCLEFCAMDKSQELCDSVLCTIVGTLRKEHFTTKP